MKINTGQLASTPVLQIRSVPRLPAEVFLGGAKNKDDILISFV